MRCWFKELKIGLRWKDWRDKYWMDPTCEILSILGSGEDRGISRKGINGNCTSNLFDESSIDTNGNWVTIAVHKPQRRVRTWRMVSNHPKSPGHFAKALTSEEKSSHIYENIHGKSLTSSVLLWFLLRNVNDLKSRSELGESQFVRISSSPLLP